MSGVLGSLVLSVHSSQGGADSGAKLDSVGRLRQHVLLPVPPCQITNVNDNLIKVQMDELFICILLHM